MIPSTRGNMTENMLLENACLRNLSRSFFLWCPLWKAILFFPSKYDCTFFFKNIRMQALKCKYFTQIYRVKFIQFMTKILLNESMVIIIRQKYDRKSYGIFRQRQQVSNFTFRGHSYIHKVPFLSKWHLKEPVNFSKRKIIILLTQFPSDGTKRIFHQIHDFSYIRNVS